MKLSRFVPCFALLGWAAGCQPDAAPDTEPPPEDEPAAVVRCDDQLENALHRIRPENVRSSDVRSAVALLNTWQTCVVAGGSQPPSADPVRAALAERADGEYLDRVAAERFVSRDGLHLRDCLLAREIADSVVAGQQTDLQRVVSLFYHVIRNVSLWPDRAPQVALQPFDVLLFGHGTPEDRAWNFAQLLRQLHIDAVILRPEGRAARDAWLMGVLLDGDIYLFDPRLGLPLPGDSGDSAGPLIEEPATLAKVLADPQVAARFTAESDRPYPLEGEDFTRLRPELIGVSSLWAPRIEHLQQSLTGDRSAVIAMPIADTDLGPGLLARVADAHPNWDAASVGLWDYPERTAIESENPSATEMRQLEMLMLPFRAPLGVDYDTEQQRRVATGWEWGQLKIRMDQLRGEFEEILAKYQRIRLRDIPDSEVQQLPPERVAQLAEMLQVHRRAAEDAFYWSGIVKYEQGEYALAASMLSDYNRRYPRGAWRYAAQYMVALSHAGQGKFDEAVAELENMPGGDPQRAGNRLLRRQWARLSE